TPAPRPWALPSPPSGAKFPSPFASSAGSRSQLTQRSTSSSPAASSQTQAGVAAWLPCSGFSPTPERSSCFFSARLSSSPQWPAGNVTEHHFETEGCRPRPRDLALPPETAVLERSALRGLPVGWRLLELRRCRL